MFCSPALATELVGIAGQHAAAQGAGSGKVFASNRTGLHFIATEVKAGETMCQTGFSFCGFFLVVA